MSVQVSKIYTDISRRLKQAAKNSKYLQDAQEDDPRYKSYGVRMPIVRDLYKNKKKEIQKLDNNSIILLCNKLIQSGLGEKQTIGLLIAEEIVKKDPGTILRSADTWLDHFYGWSKVDHLCNGVLLHMFDNHEQKIIQLARKWNRSKHYWKRRASVVVFTRKVGESGKYTDEVISLIEKLKFDPEKKVLQGVGWALKDCLRGDKKKVYTYIKKLRTEGVSSVVILYALRDLPQGERREVLDI